MLLIGSTPPPPPPHHPPWGRGVSSHWQACVYIIGSTISFHRNFFLIKYSKAPRPYFFFPWMKIQSAVESYSTVCELQVLILLAVLDFIWTHIDMTRCSLKARNMSLVNTVPA